MSYIIIGLGIIINSYLKSISLVLFGILTLHQISAPASQVFAQLLIIPSVFSAYLILRSLSLKSRLPPQIPGFTYLVIGVWIFVISYTVDFFNIFFTASTDTSSLGPQIHAQLSAYLPKILTAILVLVGIFSAFLAAKAPQNANRDNLPPA